MENLGGNEPDFEGQDFAGDECRVCLRKTAEICQLFRNGLEIPRKLMALAAVEVQEGDGLPSAICLPCNRLLDASYEFRNRILSSDEKLRQILRLRSLENDGESARAAKDISTDVTANVSQKVVDDCVVNDDRESSPSGETHIKKEDVLETNQYILENEENSEDWTLQSEEPFKKENESKVNCSDEEEKPLICRTRQKCPHCIKSFATKLGLHRHMIIHKTKLRYHKIQKWEPRIEIIEEKSDNSEKAENDTGNGKKDKRAYKFECKICLKQFTYQKSYLSHAKSHSENQSENSHVSEQQETTSKCSLTENKTEEEEEEEDDDVELPAESLQCTQCGKLFATKRNLKRHVSTHSGLKFNCSTCGKGFSRLDKLKDHEQLKHKDEIFDNVDEEENDNTDSENRTSESQESKKKDRPSERPHKCALCPKAFAQAQSLANHTERHKKTKDTQKRFLCEVCSKCFAQSGSLVAHMRTHTGVKPYVCNVCSRAFTKSTYLHLHLRTHSGEKPYICQYCSRAFARANTLARHITMHTGEAKYHCQICTKSFRRLTSLNEHTYTHTGQRPYACKICTKRYNNAGSLYAHTKKCKAQQLSGNATNFALSIENSVPQNPISQLRGTGGEFEKNRWITEANDAQVLIYSQRKLIEDTTVNQISSNQQYMVSNVHNQKTLSANAIHPFTTDDQNAYTANSKQFKNPYYSLYPNM